MAAQMYRCKGDSAEIRKRPDPNRLHDDAGLPSMRLGGFQTDAFASLEYRILQQHRRAFSRALVLTIVAVWRVALEAHTAGECRAWLPMRWQQCLVNLFYADDDWCEYIASRVGGDFDYEIFKDGRVRVPRSFPGWKSMTPEWTAFFDAKAITYHYLVNLYGESIEEMF